MYHLKKVSISLSQAVASQQNHRPNSKNIEEGQAICDRVQHFQFEMICTSDLIGSWPWGGENSNAFW